MKVIGFDDKLNKRQAAFVIFYCLSAKPWEDYPNDSSGRQDLAFPVCLMINRADGAVGFIGGMVETGESLKQAASREVSEEIGHVINVNLEPLIAHDIGPITTHAFLAQVSYKQLRGIQEAATQAQHFGSEVTGVFLPHLIDYDNALGKGGGLVNLLQNSMAPSVREELIHFLINKNLVDKASLAAISKKAGFTLDELLQ